MQDLALLNRFYPSWSLTELKRITHRMRKWWIEMGVWRKQKGA